MKNIKLILKISIAVVAVLLLISVLFLYQIINGSSDRNTVNNKTKDTVVSVQESSEPESKEEITQSTETATNMRPLSEDDVSFIIGQFECWMYLQTESLDGLTDEDKLEICAVTARHNGRFRDDLSDDEYYQVDKDVINDILNDCFNNTILITPNNNTDLLTVYDDTIRYDMDGWAPTYNHYYFESFDKLDGNQYSVSVMYDVYDEEIDTYYNYCKVTYLFHYLEGSEYFYYIEDLALDYVFIGWDEVEAKREEKIAQNENIAEYLGEQIVKHYTDLWEPTGMYTYSPQEMMETDSSYEFILRYAMSDEEAMERLANGQSISANTLVTTVYVDKTTGEVTDQTGEDSWYIDLPQ